MLTNLINHLIIGYIMAKFNTIDIKGKKYVEVKERVKAYWELYPKGRIVTEIIHHDLKEGTVIMKASVYDSEGNIKGDGHAHEFQADRTSMVNKTSFIENCETSAIGRACATAGILVEYGMASADEVTSAIKLGKEMDDAKIKKSISSFTTATTKPKVVKPAMDLTPVSEATSSQLESIMGKSKPVLTSGATANNKLIALNVKAMKVTTGVEGKAVSDEYRKLLADHKDEVLPKALCDLVVASLNAANDKITNDNIA